jgi:hypothetical protein
MKNCDPSFKDYLMFRTVQPFSLRNEFLNDSRNLEKNLPLYFCKHVGKVREKKSA